MTDAISKDGFEHLEKDALRWARAAGRDDRAGRGFDAPSHLHRAEIYARLGRRTDAAEHYERFIELWKEADLELQPDVVTARARLEELRR